MKLAYRLLSLVALLSLAPAASAQWSDNFDSYSLGGLAGQGGWVPWDDDPTADANVVNTYSLSSPQSVEIMVTTDIVQQFDVTEGAWVITAHQYIPSGSSGKTYFILLNIYNPGPTSDDWSLDMEFDCDLGLMRILEGSGAAYIVYDQWVEIRVEFDLLACTQQVYYNGVFIESLPWQTSGVNELDALDLFSDTGTSVYYDDITLEEWIGLAPTTWGQIKTLME